LSGGGMTSTDSSCWGLLDIMLALAGLSALAMFRSVHEGAAEAAWVCAAIFLGASLIATGCFWRLI
jgi:hypothetical protein